VATDLAGVVAAVGDRKRRERDARAKAAARMTPQTPVAIHKSSAGGDLGLGAPKLPPPLPTEPPRPAAHRPLASLLDVEPGPFEWRADNDALFASHRRRRMNAGGVFIGVAAALSLLLVFAVALSSGAGAKRHDDAASAVKETGAPSVRIAAP
jgi:hypothetical protein